MEFSFVRFGRKSWLLKSWEVNICLLRLSNESINSKKHKIYQITVYNQEWLTIDCQATNLPRSIQSSFAFSRQASETNSVNFYHLWIIIYYIIILLFFFNVHLTSVMLINLGSKLFIFQQNLSHYLSILTYSTEKQRIISAKRVPFYQWH